MFCKQRGQEYPMHCIIKTHRQKAWDDGVAPGDKENPLSLPKKDQNCEILQPRNLVPKSFLLELFWLASLY